MCIKKGALKKPSDKRIYSNRLRPQTIKYNDTLSKVPKRDIRI